MIDLEENVCFEEQDIKTQIAIIERSIEIFESELHKYDLEPDHIQTLEKRVTKEYKSLEIMKEKYPEYFI